MMRRAALIGLAFGAGAVHLAAVGVLLAMHQRWIVIEVLSLGQAALVPARWRGARFRDCSPAQQRARRSRSSQW
jgi:hypothetical protein